MMGFPVEVDQYNILSCHMASWSINGVNCSRENLQIWPTEQCLSCFLCTDGFAVTYEFETRSFAKKKCRKLNQ